jgi:hypothetical protein
VHEPYKHSYELQRYCSGKTILTKIEIIGLQFLQGEFKGLLHLQVIFVGELGC